MRLTLRQLRIFLAIAEHGTTIAAAESLPLSQSATSNALGELESLLGAPLFDRIGRRLQLNETGRALLAPARAALEAVAGIERDFGLEEGGSGHPVRLRVGASTTVGNYLLPPRIAALLRQHPGAGVELRIGNTREIVEAVARLEVDAGLIEGPCHLEALEVQPWQADPLVLVAAPPHPLAGRAEIGPATLAAQTWLLREPGSGTRESVDNALLPHLGGFARALQLGSTEAIKRTVSTGAGIACLSRHAVADALQAGSLVELRTCLPALSRPLYRVRHPGKRFSPALARLLDASAPDQTVVQAQAGAAQAGIRPGGPGTCAP